MTRKRLNTINMKLGTLNNLEYILEQMKREFKNPDRDYDMAFIVERYSGTSERFSHSAIIDYEYLEPALKLYCEKLNKDLLALGLED